MRRFSALASVVDEGWGMCDSLVGHWNVREALKKAFLRNVIRRKPQRMF